MYLLRFKINGQANGEVFYIWSSVLLFKRFNLFYLEKIFSTIQPH